MNVEIESISSVWGFNQPWNVVKTQSMLSIHSFFSSKIDVNIESIIGFLSNLNVVNTESIMSTHLFFSPRIDIEIQSIRSY